MSETGRPSNDVVSSVLSFYGSQLTSHTSMIVGFIVGFFTLVQVRDLALAAGLPRWGFEVAAFVIVLTVVYSLLRVVYYGGLSGILTHGSLSSYDEFLRAERHGQLDHALVHEFAMSQLVNSTRLRSSLYRRRVFFGKRANREVAYAVQPPMIISVVLASLLTTVMFGWSSEWIEFLAVLVVFVILLERISDLLAASPRPSRLRY